MHLIHSQLFAKQPLEVQEVNSHSNNNKKNEQNIITANASVLSHLKYALFAVWFIFNYYSSFSFHFSHLFVYFFGLIFILSFFLRMLYSIINVHWGASQKMRCCG